MLVPMEEIEPRAVGESREVPSLDFRCAKCGNSHTYMLSPANPAT
jgi:hypothetical protein